LALNMYEQDALHCAPESCNSQIHRA